MRKILFLIMLIVSSFLLNGCEIVFGGGTAAPTINPTVIPTTSKPVVTTTVVPTVVPTVAPTVVPTVAPTVAPTVVPTVAPTVAPTVKPSTGPTVNPTPTYDMPTVMNLSIIEMNDIHGYITQNDNGAYGLSNAAYKINEIRNEDSYDNTVLIGNGDMFQGTGLVKMSYGRVLIESMNEMGFDACGIGNHEFDWGLDKITQYFDGDAENGEANFPLLNTNIKYSSTNQLLLDQNILTSTIVNKNGLKVGIMSLIGDVYSSICYNMVKDYKFDNSYSTIVAAEGAKLKENGADIIIVNIHDGNSSGISSFSPNKTIANLKYNGEYLVDAVINGHTHTRQYGTITRSGGVEMPVIQSSGNLATFGRINLNVNMQTKKVTSVSTEHIYPSNSTYDKSVETVINNYYNVSKSELEEVYCQNVYLSKSNTNLRNWVCNVANSALNTDVFICNTGGLRSNVSAGDLDFNDIYQLNPFDNRIIIISLTGAKIKEFINNNSSYYFTYTKTGAISTLNDSQTYKLGIIDYVYFSSYFEKYQQANYVDTEIILRDLMIQDLRLRTGTFDPSVDSSAKISQIYFG